MYKILHTQFFPVLLATQAVNLSADQNVTLRFYAYDPNPHNILLKLENGTQADVQVLAQITGSANTWKDITFNFASVTQSSTGSTINATGQYDRVVLFIDFGATIAGTYLIDQINNGAVFTPPNPIDVVYADLVWSDEFDTAGTNNSIDATKWFHQTQLPTSGSWFNGEQHHYTNRLANSFVENGFLNIVAKRESFTNQGQTKQFTSVRLDSKVAFTYGRVEVRAKLPFGNGTWPAIWTLGKNINEDGAYWDSTHGTTSWPLCGEIDSMEHGLGALNHVSAALHTACAGCFGNTRNVRYTTLTEFASTFHVYAMNWSPQQITFMVDNVPFYTYNPTVKDVTTYPFFEDQYTLLNIAMGDVAGAIDPNFIQSSMVIDYVRVYQNVLSSKDDIALTDLRMYLNPASDVLYFTTAQPLDKVELYDLTGKLIISKTQQTNLLDITAVHPGLYLVKIFACDAVVTRKVVIQQWLCKKQVFKKG